MLEQRTWRSLWQNSRVPLWRWEKLPEGQPSLQQSINQAFLSEWPDGSHSSVKGTWQTAWFAKRHLKTLRPWETRWSDETKLKQRLNSLAWMPSITAQDLRLGEGSPSNRTTTLSTQPRRCRSGFRQVSECPWVSQPEPGLESDWTSLERPENSCAATLPIQPDRDERICREEWEKLPKYRCAKLVASYPRRLEAVIAAKGSLTQSKLAEY